MKGKAEGGRDRVRCVQKKVGQRGGEGKRKRESKKERGREGGDCVGRAVCARFDYECVVCNAFYCIWTAAP